MGVTRFLKQQGFAAGVVAAFLLLVILGARQGFQSGTCPANGSAVGWMTRLRPTPYQARVIHALRMPGPFAPTPGPGIPRSGRTVVAADIYGVGYQQLAMNTANGILLVDHDGHGVRLLDQLNLPPDFGRSEPFAALFAPYDIDGDGLSEIVAVAPRHDHGAWHCWVLDMENQVIKGEVGLPVGEDRRRPDGLWDGSYVPVGSLALPGLAHPAILLACQVGHDVDGRGLLAVDPLAGEVIWRFAMGCCPSPDSVTLVDLDHDGRPEIVCSAYSPNNLHGELINGTSDDRCYVFVLDAAGTLRWKRALGGPNSGISLAVADLDGNGEYEIVTATQDIRGLGGRLSIWTGHGELLMDRQAPGRRPCAVRVMDTGDGRPPRLIVAYMDGKLESCRWDGRDLGILAQRVLPPGYYLGAVVDGLAGLSGQQLTAAGPDEVLLLDAGLRTLAAVPAEIGARHQPAFVWRARHDARFLVIPGATGFLYDLAPRALVPAWFWFAAAAAVVVLAGLAARRRKRCETRPVQAGLDAVETDPAVVRAMRRQILGILEKGGHEKIGLLKSLRRLIWNLEAAVAMNVAQPGAAAGRAAVNPAVQRSLEAAQAFRGESLSLLREMLSLVRRAAIAPHMAATVADILDDVDALLEEKSLRNGSLTEVLADVERLNSEAEVALQRLRRVVEAVFRCSFPRAVQSVLDAQADHLRAGGVMVEIAGGDSAGAAPWARIDPPDLHFILDNLVGNAIRAMAGAPRRVLQLGWRVQPGQVVCTVTDTGKGIAREYWERIFDPDASDRQDGGIGLARSRHELGAYGGSLRVLASHPGRGTTFELRLMQARVADGADGANPPHHLKREAEA